MKRYTFEVIVEEGNDEFWESLNNEPDTTGRFLVRTMIEETLYGAGFVNLQVNLKKYEETN